MGLKPQVDTLESVEEQFRSLYKERNGKFLLDVDGMVPETALDSLKEAMNKRLADVTQKLDGFKGAGLTRDDVLEAVREASKPAGGGGGGGGGDDGGRISDLERRLASLESEKTKAEGERDAAITEGQQLRLTTQLQSAAMQAGVRENAVDSLVRIVMDEFEVSTDGKAKTKVDAGVGPDLDPGTFFEKVQTDSKYDFFWPQSTGGGADSSRGGGGSGGDNPWSRQGWNLTKQGAMLREDRGKAERLAQSVGSKIGATKPPPAPAT